jgi:hypothetical protein
MIRTILLSGVLALAPRAALAQRYEDRIEGDAVRTSFETQSGCSTALWVPTVFSDGPARDQLIGGRHPSSLRRDSLRRERAAEAVRELVYQADLAPGARARAIEAAIDRLRLGGEAVGTVRRIASMAPEVVEDTVRVVAAAGPSPLDAEALRSLSRAAPNLGRALATSGAIVRGGGIVADFLLYQALATDAATLRLDALERSLALSSERDAADPALMQAVADVRRELRGMLEHDGWRAVADTFERNRDALVRDGGKSLAKSAVKRLAQDALGGAGVPAAPLVGTLWLAETTIDSVADHHRQAQRAVMLATLAARLRDARALVAQDDAPVVDQLALCAQRGFSLSLVAAADAGVAQFHDAVGSLFGRERTYAQIRDQYRAVAAGVDALLAEPPPPRSADAAPPPARTAPPPLRAGPLRLGVDPAAARLTLDAGATGGAAVRVRTVATVESIDWRRTDGKESYESLISIGVSGVTTSHLDVVLIKAERGFVPAVWSSSRPEARARRAFAWGQERTFLLEASGAGVRLTIDGDTVIDDRTPAPGDVPLLPPGQSPVFLGAHRWKDGSRAAMRGSVREFEASVTPRD